MPFTFAHPAAVLPLRRFCPRFLSFPALVAGSLSPDVGYCFETFNAGGFSHRFVGSVIFCLPVGLAILLGFYAVRAFLVRRAPAGCRQVLLPADRPVAFGWLVIVLSLWLGALTHILWDSFTNRTGWTVVHLPLLRIPVGSLAGHQVLVCHLLWYVSTFVGVCWLCLAFEQWKQALLAPLPRVTRRNRHVWNAILVGILVLPIGAVHHLTRGWPGRLLVAGFTVLLLGMILLRRHHELHTSDFGF